MLENLENSAEATGLEKVNSHSNPKERQCQRMFRLLYNCAHFTCQQSYDQNPSRQASAVHKQINSRCTSCVQERERNKKSNCQHPLDHREREFQINICFVDYTKGFDCVDHNKLWKIVKEMGIPDHLTCILRYWHAEQEATIITKHGMMDWFQIGKGVCQGCILSPCLFNLYLKLLLLLFSPSFVSNSL